MKNLNLSPEGPTTFKNFRSETLFTANYENVKKSVFDRLAVKFLALLCGIVLHFRTNEFGSISKIPCVIFF